ncbi:MAG: methionine adenosyltransferase [Mycoplasmataceae bacterium]|nr:methionine adenosyltransferase [Mycoplasmataceae bacterium]MBR3348380.1 methionine adenosyltransferase [Mycoplasmataceae bacterium]
MHMIRRKGLITSESVGKGHPDKICDQISDKILDAVLKEDPNARVAIETMATNRLIIIGGELTTTTYVDVVKLAWEVILELGYNENDFSILSNVHSQSPDINQAVDKEDDIGAGDQGIVFGFATDETKNYMPLPITIAHELVKKCEQLRKQDSDIKSDMKSQVTIDYNDENEIKLHTVLMSIQHKEGIDSKEFEKKIIDKVIKPTINMFFPNINYDFRIFVNPSGKFTIGGPIGDTGLTGRKIIVDTYGGASKHGGGAFSGKDYTKVDRSAAYAARWVAKNLVAAKIAKEVEIQISYGIGLTKPISINVETFGTSNLSEQQIIEIIEKNFDLSPKGIIESLELKKPIYYQTSFYGHFGREDINLPWEQLNKVEDIKKSIK